MNQRRCLFQFCLKLIILNASLLGFGLSSCKPRETSSPSLSDKINKVGIRVAKNNTPIELFKLESGAMKNISMDLQEQCNVGFYVQGIGEDLVEIHKKTGQYPAKMFNAGTKNEVLETSYAAARKYTSKEGKVNLTIQSNHQTAIYVVIYTSSGD